MTSCRAIPGSTLLQKAITQNNLPDQGLQLKVLFRSLLDNSVDGERICGVELSGQGKSQQVGGKGPGETPLLFDQGFLEPDNSERTNTDE